jgi:formylglycine-generating enzyme required for sulfatase activity
MSTDAPVPQLGDRLLVEVLNDQGKSACSGCRRQFPVARADQWPISFAVVPPKSKKTLRVRARLYRSSDTGPEGLPGSASVIDAVGQLPPAVGQTLVDLPLRMSCFGVVSQLGSGATCDPQTGELGSEPVLAVLKDASALPAPGSWPPAQPDDCEGEVEEGMVCVSGGLFLLGSPDFFPLGAALDPLPERLVQLSAFALDVDEMTVGKMRELVNTEGLDEPILRSSDPNASASACTYLGAAVVDNDALPVNCVPYALAAEACDRLGKRLPTEAEWEYAAGNLGEETTYPWGGDDDVCAKAIVARGRSTSAFVEEITSCREGDNDWGPVAGGSEEDRTTLGIRNLGGNLDEWVADSFKPYSDPCWDQGTRLLVNPRCDAGASKRSIRGGNWGLYAFGARAFQRDGSTNDGWGRFTGFRCAKSM